HWATYFYKCVPAAKHIAATIWSGQTGHASVFTTYDWSETEAGINDPLECTRVNGPIHATDIHFRTPPRPALYAAREHIHTRQGRGGLWFTGSYLRETGFHEDGLVSTLYVLKKLLPERSSLIRMQALLEAVRCPDDLFVAENTVQS